LIRTDEKNESLNEIQVNFTSHLTFVASLCYDCNDFAVSADSILIVDDLELIYE